MESSLRPVVNGRKQQILGLNSARDENRKPIDVKMTKGLGDRKTSRGALVPLVIQPPAVPESCATKENVFCKENEISKKRHTKQDNKISKQKKTQATALGIGKSFQPKFTIYCDEEGDKSNDDDDMSLIDEEEHDEGNCLSIKNADRSIEESKVLAEDLSCSFQSLEKSIAVFSEDSFFSCSQAASGDVGRLVPSENFKEYTWDIMSYLLELEKKYRPEPDYMSRQPEVNTKMRNILVDWMVEVTAEYKLNDETLFLAVDYIDRFLSQMSIARSHFQLLGTASLFISSKYEEIYPPDINEFIFITDDTYTKEQILKMEALILKVLNLHLSTPTISYFLHRYLISFQTSDTVNNLAEYLCHLVLLDAQIFFKFFPSEIALSAVILATHNCSEEHSIDNDFITNLFGLATQISGSSSSELQERLNECMQELLHLQTHASSHPQQAIFTKYSGDRFLSVASLAPLSRTPAFKMYR